MTSPLLFFFSHHQVYHLEENLFIFIFYLITEETFMAESFGFSIGTQTLRGLCKCNFLLRVLSLIWLLRPVWQDLILSLLHVNICFCWISFLGVDASRRLWSFGIKIIDFSHAWSLLTGIFRLYFLGFAYCKSFFNTNTYMHTYLWVWKEIN